MHIYLDKKMNQHLSEVSIQKKLYKILHKISSGGYGTVFKASYEGKKYAIKQLKVDSNSKIKCFITELAFVNRITGKFDESFPLIKVFGYELIEKTLYYVMELGNNSLENYCLDLMSVRDLKRASCIWMIWGCEVSSN